MLSLTTEERYRTTEAFLRFMAEHDKEVWLFKQTLAKALGWREKAIAKAEGRK